jgi:PAS domain S-box-containing protein
MKDRITLGLLIDQLVSGYARLIIDGVSRGSRAQDANLIIFSGRILGTPIGHEYQSNVIFDYIKPGTIDALVTATGTQGTFLAFDHLLAYFGKLKGIPLVSIGVRMKGVPSVLTDNRSGIQAAMAHLVDVHGFHRIAFLKGPLINHEAGERFETYRESVRVRGLDEDPDLWLPGDFTRAGARVSLSRYLHRHGRPKFDALLAANDEMAIGAMEALREHGCTVPRDAAVIGFDNISDAQFSVPSLTTVGQQLAEQGQAAAGIAIGMVRGDTRPAEIVLPARLLPRTSCGCLPQAVNALDSLTGAPEHSDEPAPTPGQIVERSLAGFTLRPQDRPMDVVRRLLLGLVEKAGTPAFLRQFQETLNEEAAAGVDMTDWQPLLSRLQGALLAAARSTREAALLQAVFQKALVVLSEMLRLEQGKSLSELQGHMAQLRRVTERLASVATIDDLMDDLADELGLLDIHTCFIACYPDVMRHPRADPWVVPDRAEATLVCVDDARIVTAPAERVFSPADRFIPPRFLPTGRRYTLIATATFFREDQIGYIAFEPGRRDLAIYETLCVQLSSLLNSSLLNGARQRIMEALERERALIAVLMDTIPDHIYFKDERSRFILINRSMAGFIGMDNPNDAVGRTDFDFFTAEHAQPALETERAIMRSGEPVVDLEEKETMPDGRVTWAATTKMPLRDRQGRIIGTFGLSRDITERRHAEERILRLAALVESSRDAIFGVDVGDLVTSWNRGAEEMYGYTADEVTGQPVWRLMSAEAREAARKPWDDAKTGSGVSPFESMGTKKNGASFSVSCTLAPIRGPTGVIVGVAVVARDMTKEKALQARLIQAQRLESLEILAAGIAHQFNNINTVIKGYLDAIMDSPGISSDAQSYSKQAQKGVERLVDITERLQGLTASSEPGADTCGLSPLTRATLQDFQKQLDEMHVEVILDMQETPPVRIHRSRAGFVLASLVGNALDAMIDSPVRTLTIRTGVGSRTVFLEIRDTGCGIQRADIPRLFTPFFTKKGEWADHGSPMARTRGVGLSLSVCRSTVSDSGGRIDVESEPGKGATFRVWLPTAEEGPPVQL